jgi:hypothetical protein
MKLETEISSRTKRLHPIISRLSIGTDRLLAAGEAERCTSFATGFDQSLEMIDLRKLMYLRCQYVLSILEGMNVYFVLNGITFVWDDGKVRINLTNHDGISFQQAAEVFFDPFLVVVDASRNEEARDIDRIYYQYFGQN